MIELIDFRGTLVEEGDTIVYPVRQSSSVWLQEAIVEKISYEKECSWSDRKVLKIKARGTGNGQGWSKHTKLVTLSRPDRVVVVSKSSHKIL